MKRKFEDRQRASRDLTWDDMDDDAGRGGHGRGTGVIAGMVWPDFGNCELGTEELPALGCDADVRGSRGRVTIVSLGVNYTGTMVPKNLGNTIGKEIK